MTDPEARAVLVAALRTQRQIDMDGCEVAVSRQACDEAADALEAQAAEIALLQEAVNAEEMRANENKARAEKAEAALSESQAAEEGAMMILAQTIAERDAARKALSESQAREAALHRAITEASEPDFIWGAMDNVHDMDTTLVDFAEAASRAIRAAVPTPADAQAALEARINAAKEEGYLIAMAEAEKLGAYIVACPAILAKIEEAE